MPGKEESLSVRPPRPSSRPQTNKRIAILLLTALVAVWIWGGPAFIPGSPFPGWEDNDGNPGAPGPAASAVDGGFTDWDTIKPSEDLAWVPCFGVFGPRFQCARLTVAMDPRRPLNESADHPKVHIALVLVPGVGHSEDSGVFSESPLLLNPGGPGGSGAAFALSAGPGMQRAMGPDMDIIGFDPRGIGATWPQTDCFLTEHDDDEPVSIDERNRELMHRATWMLQESELGLVNSSADSLPRILTHSKAVSQLCKIQDAENSIFKYTGTPHVAQDMLSIVQAWDRWTDGLKEKKKQQQQTQTKKTCMDEAAEALSQEVDGKAEIPSTRGKLVYWGFSYGTFLGATFASMFPDKVGRLVLDGVVNSEVYFTPEGWTDSVRNTDNILEHFYTTCHEAGKECDLYRDGDSADDIKQRLQGVFSKIEKDPLIFVSKDFRTPFILSVTLLKGLLFGAMYSPMAAFPLVALIVNMLYTGEGLESLIGGGGDLFLLCTLKTKLPQYPEDSSKAIGCSDWRSLKNSTLSDYQDQFETMARKSYFGDVWMSLLTRCSGWDIEPVDPPAMKWDNFPRPGDDTPANTSFPILWVSTSNDPVTPLQQALLMSQRFAGSGLIEQLSDGHCSLSAVSLCSLGKIKAYLSYGVVPDPPRLEPRAADDDTIHGKWDRCRADEKPWKPFKPDEWVAEATTEGGSLRTQAEVDMLSGWKDVQQAFRSFQHHVQPLPMKVQEWMRVDYEVIMARLERARLSSLDESLYEV